MAKSKKGSKFERDMCKLLSLWFSHGKRDDIFWRTAGSGARATVRMKNQGKMTADSAGDICAIHESAKPLTRKCIFELKRGYSQKNRSKGISLLTMVDKLVREKDPVLVEWFVKLNKELKDHDREHGFIIFQRDRKNACITLNLSTFQYLNERNPKKLKYALHCPAAHIYLWNMQIVVLLLEDFLRWCQPETLTRKIKRRHKGKPWEWTEEEMALLEKWRGEAKRDNRRTILRRSGKSKRLSKGGKKIKRRKKDV